MPLGECVYNKKTSVQNLLTQDITRRARTLLWEPKKGKTRNMSFFGTVAIGRNVSLKSCVVRVKCLLIQKLLCEMQVDFICAS